MVGSGNQGRWGIQTQPVHTPLQHRGQAQAAECNAADRHSQRKGWDWCARQRGGIQTWAVHTALKAQLKKEQITHVTESEGSEMKQVHIKPVTQRTDMGS